MPYTEQYIKEHFDEPQFRRCYWCKHYYTDMFCGYNSSNCWIYGSLDMDQKERHPDKTAQTCPDFTLSEKKREKELSWAMKYLMKGDQQNVKEN